MVDKKVFGKLNLSVTSSLYFCKKGMMISLITVQWKSSSKVCKEELNTKNIIERAK